jgi:hypothetical protein
MSSFTFLPNSSIVIGFIRKATSPEEYDAELEEDGIDFCLYVRLYSSIAVTKQP